MPLLRFLCATSIKAKLQFFSLTEQREKKTGGGRRGELLKSKQSRREMQSMRELREALP